MSELSIPNAPAPGVPYFTPAQYPPSGTAAGDESSLPTLFKPLKIRGVEFQNRIWVRWVLPTSLSPRLGKANTFPVGTALPVVPILG